MERYIGYSLMSIAGFAGWYLCKRKKSGGPLAGYLPVLGAVSLLCLSVALWEGRSPGSGEVTELARQESGDRQVTLLRKTDGRQEGTSYPVTVEEQRLTEAQKRQLMEGAIAELEELMLGGQEGEPVISGNLAVPKVLQEGRVQAAYSFYPGDVIDTEGVVHWAYFKEQEPLVQVTVLLECQEAELYHEFYLHLERPPVSEEERFDEALAEQLRQQNQQTDTDRFALPREVLGRQVAWYQEEEAFHWKIFLLGVAGILIHYIAQRSKRERLEKEWKEGLIMDYPDIVSRLSLLVGAGMTANGAIGKLALEYQRSYGEGRQPMHPGYEELLRTWNEIQDGTGERKAYENLGNRCGRQEYRKLSSLLIQNVQKGAKGIQQLLDAEVTEVYLQRQAYVKRRGEEASAKLLLPMGIMLVLVFAILILPAIFSLQLS